MRCFFSYSLQNPSAARAVAILIFAVLFALPLAGQTTTSALAFSEPELLKVGAPAGSYALTGIDSVNLFNGSLGVHLPLLAIKGRGAAGYTLTLPWYQRWRIDRIDNGSTEWRHAVADNPNYQYGTPNRAAYSPGTMEARAIGVGQELLQNCPVGQVTLTEKSQVRLSFISPDGSSIELFDKASDGALLSIPVCGEPAASGPEFVSKDGSSTTFTSDQPVAGNWAPGTVERNVSGVLHFRNGLRYRIDLGEVTWIEDRNGNRMSFTYTVAPSYGLNGQRTTGISTVTDNLGRVATITYGSTANPCDQISFQGQSGTTRLIKICFTNLGSRLASGMTPASDYVLAGPQILFPHSYVTDSGTFDPMVIAYVQLPDNRKYEFFYNRYGEAARIKLPTGGHFDYLYSGAFAWCGSAEGDCMDGVVYRRLIERQVYTSDTVLEGKTQYQLQEGTDSAHCVTPIADASYSVTCVTATHRDNEGASLGSVRHIYQGSAERTVYRYFDTVTLPYAPWDEGKEVSTQFMTPGNVTLQTQTTTWTQPPLPWWTLPSPYYEAEQMPNNPRIDHEDMILDDNRQRRTSYSYDEFLNRKQVFEYAYGLGAIGGLVRETETVYKWQTETPSAYATTTLAALPYSVTLKDGTAVARAVTTYNYDSGAVSPCPGTNQPSPVLGPRGNQTSVSRKLMYPGESDSWLVESSTYDVAGNVRSHTDPKLHTTTFGYTNPAYNCGFPDFMQNALGQQTTFAWDTHIGRVLSITDPNFVQTTALYNDPLDRITNIKRAVGKSDEAHTAISYDTLGPASMCTVQDKQVLDDPFGVKQCTVFDGIGKQSETRQYESASSYISTFRAYDGMGRHSKISNPTRGGSPVWTTTVFDILNRPTSITHPDGAVLGWLYTGAVGRRTDEVGNVRTLESDALGRLVAVVEDPGGKAYQTIYTYTTLDNLESVTQGGIVRTFAYDSLGRLRRAINPENRSADQYGAITGTGAIDYVYDGDGNLVERKDARLFNGNRVLTCYGSLAPGNACDHAGYDALHRVTRKSYSDGTGAAYEGATPSVTYSYDQFESSSCPADSRNGVGRLSSVSNANSTTQYSCHDALGRVRRSIQTPAAGSGYRFDYTYNKAGGLTDIAYPSGRVVSTSLDALNRPSGLTGVLNSANTTYATGIQYADHGAVSQMTLDTVWNNVPTGAALTEQSWFNLRLQPIGLRQRAGGAAGSNPPDGADRLHLAYQYYKTDPLKNNGSVYRQTITAHGGAQEFSQSYDYDKVDRLISAQETGPGAPWSQTYDYDAVGNRWVTGGADLAGYSSFVPQASSVFDANNQAMMNNAAYDAGNQSQIGGLRFSYDAENRLLSATLTSTTSYRYDGEGRRVRIVNGGTTTDYVYDAAGQLAAEYVISGTPTALPCGPVCYVMTDTLGSTRMLTNSGQIKALHDYFPFGEEVPTGTDGRTALYGGADPRPKFTGKERDSETGLDYFGARYFSGAQGRFTSPDPENASASLFNPQAWNAYSYALNNPHKYVDPDGEVPLLVTGAIGAGIGAVGGAGFNFVSQWISAGGDLSQISGKQVFSAALGGAVQGGLAGLTLGVGTAAVGIGEAALANGAANVIGGIVTRGTNELLGVPSAPNAPSETTSVAVDFAMGAVGGGYGARQANVRYPLPNVRKELAIIANSNRRSLRPAKVEAFTQYANQQQINNTVRGSVIGTSVMGFFTDLFFRAGNVFNPPPVQAKEKVTSKICYTDDSGKQVCQ